jgi:acetolactate synthase-1/2/3 large subunit
MKETQTIQSQAKSPETTERISGSEAVIKCLLAEGVDILYGYPGGGII